MSDLQIILIVMVPWFAATLATVMWHRSKRPTSAPSLAPSHSVEVELILSLMANGSDWQHSEHRLWHPTGACMWIANKDYGMKLALDVFEKDVRASFLADVTPLVPLTKAEQSALWNAACKLVDGYCANDRQGRLGAFAQRVADMYELKPDTVVPFERRAR